MHAIRPWLYVGSYRDSIDLPLLTATSIRALIQLAAPVTHPNIHSLYLPIEDGEPLAPEMLCKGVAFVLSAHAQGSPVLIACGAGISRSVTLAIAVLKEIEGLSLLQAMQEIHRGHPQALPHPVLWDALCGYYHEAVPFLAMFRLLEQQDTQSGSE